jgi:hypothetical protein
VGIGHPDFFSLKNVFIFVTPSQMRNSDHFQDQDEPHHDHDESRALREEHQPASSLPSTADVRPPVNATSRRLSRAEERHLREWAGTLVRPTDGKTHGCRRSEMLC